LFSSNIPTHCPLVIRSFDIKGMFSGCNPRNGSRIGGDDRACFANESENLMGRDEGLFYDSTKVFALKRVTMGAGGPGVLNIVQIRVTSFMDDPKIF